MPKGQHFFGQRYAQACDNALKSFEADLIVKEKNEETLRVSSFIDFLLTLRVSKFIDVCQMFN